MISGRNPVLRAVGKGYNYTGLLYWALATSLIQVALSVVAIGMYVYYGYDDGRLNMFSNVLYEQMYNL